MARICLARHSTARSSTSQLIHIFVMKTAAEWKTVILDVLKMSTNSISPLFCKKLKVQNTVRLCSNLQ